MLLFIMMTLWVMRFASSEQHSRRKRTLGPEVYMNISEVIEYNGYPNEEYEILTDDGYYLIINRIPSGKNQSENAVSKPAVLVMPGILTNSGTWVCDMTKNSLGFLLADAGFDVWLANNRGSRWCKRHQNFSINQEEFWNFSFHEMAMYDLPASVNFVLNKTGQAQIYYIGYSQGTTIGFIAFSAIPQLAQKIKIFFALGPVYLLNYSKSPFVKLSFVDENFAKAVLGKRELCILPNNKTRTLVAKLCGSGVLDKLCVNLVFSSGGINKNNVNTRRLDVYASHLLGCTSVKNILHWAQVRNSGEFKQFDYGSENIKKYNQKISSRLYLEHGVSTNTDAKFSPFLALEGRRFCVEMLEELDKIKTSKTKPPSYSIKDVNVPMAIWSGTKDIMSTPRDIELLLPLLGNLIYYKDIPHWMHYDFVFGRDAHQEVYNEIVEIIQGSS